MYLGNQDPLLTSRTSSTTQLYESPVEYYHQMGRDWVGELDTKIKNLRGEVLNELNKDSEFVELNSSIQGAIQGEIMTLVKSRLNRNEDLIQSIKRQLSIIDKVDRETKEKERQGMAELNDYIQNYSHLTFDEYKRLKNEGGRDKT